MTDTNTLDWKILTDTLQRMEGKQDETLKQSIKTNGRVNALEEKCVRYQDEIDSLKASQHSPDDCKLSQNVNALQKSINSFQKTMLTIMTVLQAANFTLMGLIFKSILDHLGR